MALYGITKDIYKGNYCIDNKLIAYETTNLTQCNHKLISLACAKAKRLGGTVCSGAGVETIHFTDSPGTYIVYSRVSLPAVMHAADFEFKVGDRVRIAYLGNCWTNRVKDTLLGKEGTITEIKKTRSSQYRSYGVALDDKELQCIYGTRVSSFWHFKKEEIAKI